MTFPSQKGSFEALVIHPLFTKCLLDPLDQDIDNDEEVALHVENVLSENEVICIGQVFNDDDLAHEFYCTFAKKCGFSVRPQQTYKRVGENGMVYKRDFVCHRAGLSIQKNIDDGKDHRERKSSCCGCEAHMTVSLHVEGDLTSWRVISFSNDHDHELLNQREVRYLPAYRSISEYYSSRLLTFATTGMCVKEMMRLLEIEQVKVSVIVELRDQVGEQQTMQQKYLNVNLKTTTPIEEHASKEVEPISIVEDAEVCDISNDLEVDLVNITPTISESFKESVDEDLKEESPTLICQVTGCRT
ncbi:hypothetical protein HHK36_025874 [Tetracentron sinense]|uniref:FAR1 domain-containing protein n=1 Tax=Tetracentron sinense TaxID=13715 RepID=A0A834YP13_TETSI|nr:hypothetical protein HHK36_025874 [Tetracentron sinense]